MMPTHGSKRRNRYSINPLIEFDCGHLKELLENCVGTFLKNENSWLHIKE
jgi:hypothetical protein